MELAIRHRPLLYSHKRLIAVDLLDVDSRSDFHTTAFYAASVLSDAACKCPLTESVKGHLQVASLLLIHPYARNHLGRFRLLHGRVSHWQGGFMVKLPL